MPWTELRDHLAQKFSKEAADWAIAELTELTEGEEEAGRETEPQTNPNAFTDFADIFEAFFGEEDDISGVGALFADLARGHHVVPGGEITSSRKKRYSTQSGKGRVKGYAPWKPQKKTKIILAQIKEILREYEAELPLTARQIFYRLVGAYGYPKTESAYGSLTDLLVRARRSKEIDFEDIRDDGASVMKDSHYSGEEEFYSEIRQMGQKYERDKLANQEKDIRVYCEAAGMMPQLRRVTRQYSVPVYSCSGFDSLTAKFDLAKDVADAFTYHGRPTVILHLGDHDPSGETIFDAISEDVYAFLEVDTPQKKPKDVAIFERVALTEEQIGRYNLPTDPAKESSHSAGWGNRRACQLEALEPDVLAQILTEAIEKHLDLEVLEYDRDTETEERRKIAKALPPASSQPHENDNEQGE